MNYHVKSDNIEIRVDKRTELLGIIEIISNYKKKYPQLLKKCGNKEYIEEIEQKFSKYKKHIVIQLFNEIVENNSFGFGTPISLFLQLNDDFTFTQLDDYPFKDRLHSDRHVIEMLKGLPSFAQEIGFEEFYKQNEKRYNLFLQNVQKGIDKTNPTSFMFNYYGLENKNHFIVNLIPFQTWSNYGTHHNNHIFCNMSTSFKSSNEETMYPYNAKTANFTYLIFHEFSHSFINPLTEKYKIIDEDNLIFKEIWDIMQKQAYGRNDTIINEHIIRALTLRYCFYLHDMEEYKRRIQSEKERGFIYIENIVNSLIFYESHRDQYTNIDAYYPVIIQNIIEEYTNKDKIKREK